MEKRKLWHEIYIMRCPNRSNAEIEMINAWTQEKSRAHCFIDILLNGPLTMCIPTRVLFVDSEERSDQAGV